MKASLGPWRRRAPPIRQKRNRGHRLWTRAPCICTAGLGQRVRAVSALMGCARSERPRRRRCRADETRAPDERDPLEATVRRGWCEIVEAIVSVGRRGRSLPWPRTRPPASAPAHPSSPLGSSGPRRPENKRAVASQARQALGAAREEASTPRRAGACFGCHRSTPAFRGRSSWSPISGSSAGIGTPYRSPRQRRHRVVPWANFRTGLAPGLSPAL